MTEAWFKREVMAIADYLGCNGEELWSELVALGKKSEKMSMEEEE